MVMWISVIFTMMRWCWSSYGPVRCHSGCQGARLCSPAGEEISIGGINVLQVWEDDRVRVVPHPAQRARIVRHAHEELRQFGVKRTYSLLLGQYWWRGMHTQASEGVAYAFLDRVLSHFGAPAEVLTDRGTEFQEEFEVL
ncbi:hypothetical protein AXG93_230s1030 [Marchantia polymorpha subsp. ruderalis]|uniref:Integrase zinc-binding domain-containing protein n=1 Tax=Marchantia polymorpha subsp. ruderalis TaxID=1480154 RepID=A0A176WNN6_MARPO|nr:hypothetical protein AXG93_230s1030 [Marchantia polymorpha subsp. ruderalis]